MRTLSVLILAVAIAGPAAAGDNDLVVGGAASPCLKLRAEPAGRPLDCLAPGTRVTRLAASGDWAQVGVSGGATGWMAASYLEPAADAVIKLQDAVAFKRPDLLGLPLYDQTDSPAGSGFASQVFEPANAAFDCRAADDFTVPAGDVEWNVAAVTVLGAYVSGVGPTPLVDVEFYADSGGLPGAVPSCSYPGLAAGVDFTDVGGDLAITLPAVCNLPAGVYWVSVRADMDLASGGQWLWAMRSAQSSAQFSWENPANGFGTGCTSWTPAGACGATAPDLLFALSGEVVPVELQSISVD